MNKNNVILDIEVYPNWFLVAFKRIDNGKVLTFTNNDPIIKTILLNNVIIGFNTVNYDIPIVKGIMAGFDEGNIYKLSQYIINNKSLGWQTEKQYKFQVLNIDLIDLSPIVSGFVSLKTYGSRLNAKKLQSLPYKFDSVLDDKQKDIVKKYCINDLDTTELLFNELKDRIDTRTVLNNVHKTNFNVKSDAQIAEYIIKDKLNIMGKMEVTPTESFKYSKPENIKFKSDQLKDILNKITSWEFKYKDELIVPDEFSELFYNSPLTNTKFKLGIGGLHSCENSVNYTSVVGDSFVVDCDVTSYYPNIIINNNYQPKHLDGFIDVYKSIVKERIRAKENNDKVKSDTLKIVINSSFGKFGNKYSVLFSNELMINTTITGQLYLLMLIEALEIKGIPVISANTDGIVSVVKQNKNDDYTKVLKDWQKYLNLKLELTGYKSIYIRDVNNYFAVDVHNKIKKKGIFSDPSITKNHLHNVCFKAVMEHLISKQSSDPISIEEYIESCTNINDFVIVKNSKNGCYYNNNYVGNIVRFYWSNKNTEYIYDGENNIIPLSKCAGLVMDLPDELPDDINYKKYIDESYIILNSIGINEHVLL